ncbi:MAG: UDP-N-acetylglucosamine--N-acetylmuramyl-(pentapeptide) pyrophosphoryl-undecaprenol N-acetylglucosamine transferase [Clostridia bacterium]|nr:UDP-N-acetylglucosamine--N-acetylmuramyl-(pentapeptide) pyrophosphoryl-undecaprenol N-acetylglucosamine transferase [Clostridia bacterium]
MSKIVLCGGGTGGHIIPNIALIDGLKSVFNQVHYIGRNAGLEKDLIGKIDGVFYHGIDIRARFNRANLLKNFAIPFRLFSSVSQAKKVLGEIKPNVIFSKGGFVSLPVTMASGNIPVVLHESDFTLGLANKIASLSADKILTAFQTKIRRSQCVGSPLRKSIYSANPSRALSDCGFSGDKPVLLVVGGSSGAKFFNELIDNSLALLTQYFSVVHIAGKNNGERKEKDYRRIEFCDNLPDYMALCSIALTRGGANALFEFLAMEKPILVCPLPSSASRGDQVQNASYFASYGCCDTIEQEKLTSEILLKRLLLLYKNKTRYIEKIKLLPSLDGREKIIEILSKYAK